MGNLQLYSVVVTRKPEVKAALAPAHFNQPMVTSAPVVLTICADYNRVTSWCEQRGAEPGYDNMLSFLNAATDALLYTQTFSCLAEDAGLGLCFLGTTIYNPLSIINTLHLPRLVFPIATLTVGWPAEQPPLSDRLDLPAFTHADTYADYTPDDINRHYAAKEQLPESQAAVAENNVASRAHVLAHVRYAKAGNEACSNAVLQALKQQSFLSDK